MIVGIYAVINNVKEQFNIDNLKNDSQFLRIIVIYYIQNSPTKVRILDIHYVVLVTHLIVGFVLVYFAMKAFKKTRYPPMVLLALGFSLIVVGDTIVGDIVDIFVDNVFGELLEEGMEIAGFIVLILAVKRS